LHIKTSKAINRLRV